MRQHIIFRQKDTRQFQAFTITIQCAKLQVDKRKSQQQKDQIDPSKGNHVLACSSCCRPRLSLVRILMVLVLRAHCATTISGSILCRCSSCCPRQTIAAFSAHASECFFLTPSTILRAYACCLPSPTKRKDHDTCTSTCTGCNTAATVFCLAAFCVGVLPCWSILHF